MSLQLPPIPDSEQEAIVMVLADVLTALCEANDKQPPPAVVNKFHAAEVPAISIHDYLLRIKKYAQCSTQCFVLSLIYIDRLIQTSTNFLICSLNVHRILITTVMLAAKFFDDQYYNNKYYARIGGVGAEEVNQLEVEFLFMTNFTLYVSTETYNQYYSQLADHIHQSASPAIAPQQQIPQMQYPQQQIAQQPTMHQQQQMQQQYHPQQQQQHMYAQQVAPQQMQYAGQPQMQYANQYAPQQQYHDVAMQTAPRQIQQQQQQFHPQQYYQQ